MTALYKGIKIIVRAPKGGGCKTETAVQLARALAELGFQVLVVDADPQSDASDRLGWPQTHRRQDIDHSLVADLKRINKVPFGTVLAAATQSDRSKHIPMQDCIVGTMYPGVQLAISTKLESSNAELDLSKMPYGREKVFGRLLRQVADQYDYIILDTGPDDNFLTTNAVFAADHMIVPAIPEPSGIRSLAKLDEELRALEAEEFGINVLGTIATRAEMGTNRHKLGVEILKMLSTDEWQDKLRLAEEDEYYAEFVHYLGSLRPMPFLGTVDKINSTPRDLLPPYRPIAQKIVAATRPSIEIRLEATCVQ